MSDEPCGNDDPETGCLKCYPRAVFVVSRDRIARVRHSRTLMAIDARAAFDLYSQGTTWPESYDERDVEIVERQPVVVRKLEPGDRGYPLSSCWHDLPSNLTSEDIQ